MGNALFVYENKVDLAVATLGTDSQVGTLPVANVANPIVGRKWRTSGTTAAYLDVDFGEALSIGTLALMGCSFASADTVRHRLSAVSAGAGELLDTGATSSGVATGYGLHFYELASPVSAQYWRADISAPSLAAVGYFEVGRALAGAAWQPERNLSYGKGDAWADDSRVSRAEKSGAEFVDLGPRYRNLAFQLGAMSSTDETTAKELERLVGLNGQVLLVPNPDSGWPTNAIFGRLAAIAPITQQGFNVFAKAYRIRESK